MSRFVLERLAEDEAFSRNDSILERLDLTTALVEVLFKVHGENRRISGHSANVSSGKHIAQLLREVLEILWSVLKVSGGFDCMD